MKINPQTEQKQKPILVRAAGYTAGTAIAFHPVYQNIKSTYSMPKESQMKMISSFMMSKAPDIDSFENVKNVASKVMASSGLDKKGVELHFINENNAEKLVEDFMKKSKIANPFAKETINNFFSMIKEGANATFIPKIKKIYAGEKSLYSEVFHEMGHALNHTSSPFWKIIQSSRQILTPLGIPIAGLILFTMGLFHKTPIKEQDTQPTTGQKIKKFGRKHAGKITFLTSLPILAEEAVASLKGINLAKKHFSPKKIKQLGKNFKFAFNTYLKQALIFSAAIGLGNIIIDFVQKPKTTKA